jgi:serine O-acetyltransferase
VPPIPEPAVGLEPSPDSASAPAVDRPLAALAEHIAAVEAAAHGRLPDRDLVAALGDRIVTMLFPDGSREPRPAGTILADFDECCELVRRVVEPLGDALPSPAAAICHRFIDELPEIHRRLELDASAIEAGDPAAESTEEVVLAYPGFAALAFHRIAHAFHALGVPLVPRILAETAHHRTGIDIHPAARLGSPVVIDHGTGIVVGETAVIGDNVKLYQGVTLGALSVTKSLATTKRHPTIEDGVVIYANATILGGETTIGRDSVIGGNVWLTSSVPPGSVVYHRSEVHVRTRPDEPLPDFVI